MRKFALATLLACASGLGFAFFMYMLVMAALKGHLVLLACVLFLVTAATWVGVTAYFKSQRPASQDASHLVRENLTGLEDVELEEVEEVKAWKTGLLLTAGRVQGVGYGEYSMDDTAVCARGGLHTSPDLKCTCGFYAFKKRSKAVRLQKSSFSTGVLEVDLYGTIIEGTKGYRAQEQVVLALHLPTRCECLKKAVGVKRVKDHFEASCQGCLGNGLSTKELADFLQIEVTHTLRPFETASGLKNKLRKKQS